MATNPDLVFDAVRRGYGEMQFATNQEIVEHFQSMDKDSAVGHTSNIKGIMFEQAYVEKLSAQGIDAEAHAATNHPVTDIVISDDGEVISEVQLKATDSSAYINETLETHPDVVIVATSEVAEQYDSEMVINSGIGNGELESEVTSTLFAEGASEAAAESIGSELAGELITDAVLPVSPIGIGISIIGAMFGLII